MPPGAQVTELADTLGHDIRIGCRSMGPGLGFGGSCPSKDPRRFITGVDERCVDEAAGIRSQEPGAIRM
ncbi:hypothetical protein [Streptomyces sp. MS1.AVA.4]|uniref:Uncharacterized protein n=1 Tax=Streptomyces pratisoli TaxID=3139917 RepID=A0ACC6QKQ6_9ACTN